MNELRPHGRELLEAARRERTPSSAQRERVLSALLEGAPRAKLPGQLPSATRASSPSGGRKLLILIGLAALIVLGIYMAGHVGAPH